MNLPEYQKFIVYNDFFKTHEEKDIVAIKDQIESINANCSNKNFIIILIFEKWINSYDYTSYVETATTNTFSKRASANQFLDLDFYPFIDIKKTTTTDIFHIFDISNIIAVFNNLKIVKSNKSDPLKKIKDIYKFINDNIHKKTIKPNIHRTYYINQPYSKIEQANDGLFVNLIKLLNPEKMKEYLSKKATYIKGKDLLEKILKDIEKIKKIQKTDLTSLTICISKETEIRNIANKIISFFQTIFSTINSLYKIVYTAVKKTEEEEKFSLSITGNDVSPKFTIEQLINSLEEKPIPQFKKAYVTRENNLTPFIEIKVLYYTNDQKNFIQINNFNVPYNNIISLEHNISDQKITINLIDTEGELSELLIYKMYHITTQISESKKIKNIDAEDSLPYVFEVEYGWSGPETEIEEELLKEKVYVKKKYRGYIKSISSQFSNKGTQYTLEIMPTNYENNFFDGNYYNILYSNYDYREESSFAISLFVFYLILKYWNDEVDLKNVKSAEPEKYHDADTFILEKIFYIIKYHKFHFFVKGSGNNRYYEIAVTYGGKKNGKILTNKINEKEDMVVLDLLLKNVNKEEDNSYQISQIGSENMKYISGAIDSDFKLNSWLVSVYLIWQFNYYFVEDTKKFYLFHDTTGLFDFFQDDATYATKKKIDSEKFYAIINKFNVFCFEEDTNINDNNFFIKMKEIIKNNSILRNQYYLNNIYDTKASSSDAMANKTRKLTFFNTKIQQIFSTLEYIGFNKDYDDNNVYQFSSGVNSDFATYKDSDIRYYLEIANDYKKKIYANKNFIYQASLTSENNREIDSFRVFHDNFLKTFEFLAIGNYFPGTKNNESDGEDKEKEIKKVLKDNKVNQALTKGDVNIFYLSYALDKRKIMGNSDMSLEKKVSFLSKNIMQSYSLTPRIYPKTRNSNKQFFSQGNSKLLSEGTGDIIEYSPLQFNIGQIVGLNKQMENLLNVNFDDFFNQSYINGMHENAAKYYNTYTNINGQTDKQEILKNMAQLKINYQSQINIKADITIIGEPFWSNVDFTNRSIFIYLYIYHNSGSISDYTGLYTIENVIQDIDNGKFTTKLNLIRVPTFLNSFISSINQTIMMDSK